MHIEIVASVLEVAADDAEARVDLLTFIPLLIIGVLSVPLVVTAITAIFRFISPSTRLASRLRRDLDLFKDMPVGVARDGFETHINRTIEALSSRYEPSEAVVRSKKLSWVTRSAAVVGALVAAAALPIIFSMVLDGPIETAPRDTEDVLTFFSVVVGAVGVLVPALLGAAAALFRRVFRAREANDRARSATESDIAETGATTKG